MGRQFFIDPTADILPAKEDQIFKSLLTRSEPEAKIVLMDLIGSVIGRKVTDVVIKNNELATMDTSQKQERLDVNCEIDGKEFVNIEMQASHTPEYPESNHKNVKNKSAYYGCDLFSSQSIKGKTYADLAKTYQITFIAYTVFQKADYRSNFYVMSEDGEKLTEELTIIFIELSKLKEILKKPVEEMTSLEMWSVFFECVDDPKYRKIVNEIIGAKEEIQMASTLLQTISQDDYERARFLSRRKFENDVESARNTAIKIAVDEAEKKAYEEKLEIAKNLLDVLDVETIAKKFNLTVKEVEELKKTIKSGI